MRREEPTATPAARAAAGAGPRLDGCGAVGEGADRVSRRAVLHAMGWAAAGGLLPAVRADAATDPRNSLARAGDLLVTFANGDAGPIVNLAAVERDPPPFLAWPFDPAGKIVRNGSRLNLVLLLAFEPSTLAAAERARAAAGILAYTAVCTHQGCWVTDWLANEQLLHCPCHGSRYDPRGGGAVILGPAPRPLPALPLRLAAGRLEVAGRFTDRVGGEASSGR